MTKEIADAFGLHPDSLEPVDHDEHGSITERCKSCAEWARKYAVLEAELAESRRDVERYRNQIEQLLLASSLSRH